jgi:uncharacterized protein YkwD
MRAAGAADAEKVPRLRSLLGVLVLAACLCALGGATAFAGDSSTPGAASTPGTPVARATRTHRQSSGRPHRRHRRRAHTAARCAKQSSFHASGGGHRHHKRHSTNCVKRGSGKRAGHHAKRHLPHTGKPADADTCPGADLLPTQSNIEAVRTATLCLIDQERASHGEETLQFNADLQQSSQSHTESMAFGDYFEHDGPGGDTPLSRMIACGYIPNSQVGYEIGENIGWGTFSLGTPRAIVAAWMTSPGHRANILDARFRDTAIGVSPHVPSSLSGGQPGGIYTQDFGVIITG